MAKAIVGAYRTFSGETWINPLLEQWGNIFGGVKYSEAMAHKGSGQSANQENDSNSGREAETGNKTSENKTLGISSETNYEEESGKANDPELNNDYKVIRRDKYIDSENWSFKIWHAIRQKNIPGLGATLQAAPGNIIIDFMIGYGNFTDQNMYLKDLPLGVAVFNDEEFYPGYALIVIEDGLEPVNYVTESDYLTCLPNGFCSYHCIIECPEAVDKPRNTLYVDFTMNDGSCLRYYIHGRDKTSNMESEETEGDGQQILIQDDNSTDHPNQTDSNVDNDSTTDKIAEIAEEDIVTILGDENNFEELIYHNAIVYADNNEWVKARDNFRKILSYEDSQKRYDEIEKTLHQYDGYYIGEPTDYTDVQSLGENLEIGMYVYDGLVYMGFEGDQYSKYKYELFGMEIGGKVTPCFASSSIYSYNSHQEMTENSSMYQIYAMTPLSDGSYLVARYEESMLSHLNGFYDKKRNISIDEIDQALSSDTELVTEIQTKLNELGFDCGTPDGYIGPVTENAIKEYQNSKGMEVTGKVDPYIVLDLVV